MESFHGAMNFVQTIVNLIIDIVKYFEVKVVVVDRESQEKFHKIVGCSKGPQEKITKDNKGDNNILWLEAVVAATIALEKVASKSLRYEIIQ